MRASVKKSRRSPGWRSPTRSAETGWSGSTWIHCLSRYAPTRVSRTSCAAWACLRRVRLSCGRLQPAPHASLEVEVSSAEGGFGLLLRRRRFRAQPELSRRSVRARAGRLDHASPFLGFRLHEFSELFRRASHSLSALARELRSQLR